MNKPMIALAGAGLLLTLTACGTESATGPGDQPSDLPKQTNQTGQPGPGKTGSLIGNTYLSTAVTENGKPRPLAPRTQVRLQFTADGRLIADAGCNSMQSKVSTTDGRITLDGELSSTAMGCPGPQQGQDSWLGNILQAKPSWKLDGSKLELTSGSTTISLTDRKIAEPAPALDGTRWTLATVVTGETASHGAGFDKVWLTVNGERVTGSTGCNSFQGMVARGTGTLTFGDLATTRRACPGDAGKIESTVLNGLKGQVTYKVDGKTLQLRNTAGGLDLTAP
ncbi:META domain-containing protein [Kribbella solani]|uniref:Heat shock protein HslJ n=1 Tax=Kribbella solani TaxID=236067 RepID=A0A841E230_9ACTN|nr:heat shock protein HslJ [Kribbella solani]